MSMITGTGGYTIRTLGSQGGLCLGILSEDMVNVPLSFDSCSNSRTDQIWNISRYPDTWYVKPLEGSAL